jgi:glutaredoxin-dependent peroxiredoxin
VTQMNLSTPNVGDAAPDFTLKDTQMQEVSLRDFRGRTVVVLFFPAAFSGVCTAEMCAFRDNMAAFNDVNAQVLGISVDLPYALRVFKQAQGLEFPLLSDFDHIAIEAYGVVHRAFNGFTSGVAMRSVFVVGPDGTIAWEWIADRQGEAPDYEAVQAAVEKAAGPATPAPAQGR